MTTINTETEINTECVEAIKATAEEPSTASEHPATQADTSAPATTSKRKSRSGHGRKKAQKAASVDPQTANLTRVASLLGQIKEACKGTTEGDATEITRKVAPLIEAATQIVEILQQQQTDEAKKKGNNKPSTSPSNPEPETVLRPIPAGTKIPPQFYKPTGIPAANMKVPVPRSPQPSLAMTKHLKEAIKTERQQLGIRNELRTAVSLEDFERVLAVAERMGMDYEAKACKAKIAKLKEEC